MSLTLFDQNGVELLIDTETGESFATIRGYSRMSGKAISTISERCQGVRSNDIKSAEILTSGGLQGVRLIPENLISEWIVTDNPELAKKMLKAGVRVYLHFLAGFQVSSNAVTKIETAQPQLPPPHIQVIQLTQALEKLGIDFENPRIKQGVKDLVTDILGISQHRLPQNEPLVKWVGVAERAEQLGYPVALVTRYRSVLGKAVVAAGVTFVREKRLCNGTEREINLYPMSQELDRAIANYLNAKR